MTISALLVGPTGHGGEGVFMDSLSRSPPRDVRYAVAGGFHSSAPGARCLMRREVLLNQALRRAAIPDMGFRALRLDRQFDLVHVHAHPVSLKGRTEIPVVMSEGSSSAVYLGEYLGWSETRLAKRFRRARQLYGWLGIRDRLLALEKVRKVFVFSRWARDVNIRWGADGDKLEVLYPGFPVPEPVLRENRETFTFLFVGGDFERKGGYDVVEAFARISGDYPNARLVLAGSDLDQPNPDRFLHSWVSAERKERALSRLGDLERAGRAARHRWLTQTQLRAELLPAADAFVMPTYAEGFGFANVEAMSFGLPVVTSDVGPSAEILGDGNCGWLVSPGSVDQLAEKMAVLAGDPVSATRMGITARARFEARFTLARFNDGLHDFYRRALER